MDEGRQVGEDIKERLPDEDSVGGYTTHLNYPNLLRSRPKEYMVVQLAVSFVAMVSMNPNLENQMSNDQQLESLAQYLASLVNALDDAESESKRTCKVAPYDPHVVLPAPIADPLAAIQHTMNAWFRVLVKGLQVLG